MASKLRTKIETKSVAKRENTNSTSKKPFQDKTNEIMATRQKTSKKQAVKNVKASSNLTPKSRLRGQKSINYREFSINGNKSFKVTPKKTSPVKVVKKIEAKTKHVPIYKQLSEERTKLKDKEDLYEFEVDVEEKKKVAKKRKDPRESHNNYDKTMDVIMANILKKVESRKVKNIKKVEDKKIPVKKKLVKYAKPKTESFCNVSLLEPTTVLPLAQTSTPNIARKSSKSKEKPLNKTLNESLYKSLFSCDSTSAHEGQSPWRFESKTLSRNPHFLKVKESSLPNINQEVVLDYTQETKLAPQRNAKLNVTRTPCRKQTSILDFVESSRTPEHRSVNVDNTLFDNDLLMSPDKPQTPRRTILQENNLNYTPEKSDDSKENLFGFESFSKDDKENSPSKRRTTRSRPMRINLKTFPAKKIVVQEKPVVEALSEDLPVQDKEVDDAQVNLFEDPLEPTPKNDKVFRKKKSRFQVDCTTDDEEEECPKKRKKDVMTAAELKEFNKWADEFNAMCEDVDKHQLEIE